MMHMLHVKKRILALEKEADRQWKMLELADGSCLC